MTFGPFEVLIFSELPKAFFRPAQELSVSNRLSKEFLGQPGLPCNTVCIELSVTANRLSTLTDGGVLFASPG